MTPRLEPAGVPQEFDHAARAYDRLVGANPGYHEHLRLTVQRMALPAHDALRLLDVGCGTGASTRALLDVAPKARIVAVDASAGMLAEARAKDWPDSVSFAHCSAEQLPDAGFGDFDGILAAYLVRNLSEPDSTLRALRELLHPGGVLAVHEYSIEPGRYARAVWTAVCWTIIIPGGRLLSGRAGLYRYLWRSVLHFDHPARFLDRLADAGFVEPREETMPGWQRGIVHSFLARRPAVS